MCPQQSGIKNANTYYLISFLLFSILQVCGFLNPRNPLIIGFGKIIHLGAVPQDKKKKKLTVRNWENEECLKSYLNKRELLLSWHCDEETSCTPRFFLRKEGLGLSTQFTATSHSSNVARIWPIQFSGLHYSIFSFPLLMKNGSRHIKQNLHTSPLCKVKLLRIRKISGGKIAMLSPKWTKWSNIYALPIRAMRYLSRLHFAVFCLQAAVFTMSKHGPQDEKPGMTTLNRYCIKQITVQSYIKKQQEQHQVV